MSTRVRNLSLLALGAVFALGAACEEPTQTEGGALTEIQPDCLTCLESLAECSSTAKNEQQFVGCRDVFQACQDKMSLGPDECGRPSNEIACELCKERLGHCDSGDCELEFSVCKTFLMSRAQDECSNIQHAELGDCDTCQAALAACAFGGDADQQCMATFFSCRNANLIEPAECPEPTGSAPCTLCADQRELCEAGGGTSCEAGQDQCVATLEGECETGMGGSGGGPVDPPACSHDACEAGAAMSPECDSCIAAVCEADAYCCEVEYDEYCVAKAQETAVCSCEPAATCAHDLCEAGEVLDPACDECAATVCEADGYCCNTAWDELCVSRAGELCGLCS